MTETTGVAYTVEVAREDDVWVATVLGLRGAHTFARNLKSLDESVREVIEIVLDLPEGGALPSYRYVYLNVDDAFLNAARLGEERERLEAEQRQLQRESQVSARALADEGWSVRDIGGALKMSPGRVTQILSTLSAAS